MVEWDRELHVNSAQVIEGRGMICDLKVPAGGKGGDGNEFEIA